MTRAIELRPRARSDLQQIWRYTESLWGAEQAEAYVDDLRNALHKIADNSSLGSDRSDLHDGLRKVSVKSHCIYFLCNTESIDVVRILHNRMDVGGVL